MTAKLRLAAPEDAAKLDRLMAACHDETGYAMDEDARSAALEPLLAGDVPGAAYLIGPPSSPVGYVLLRFGYSVAQGGMVADIDEIYIRPPVRNRAMASEAVNSLARNLRNLGIARLTARLDDAAPDALFRRLLFKGRSEQRLDLAL
ncbi:hypothetical protein SAMN04488012_101168 [Palleronia salina]|uniref:N-acetyltransferase domain-containing protein n=1 Tax=Palleronia salina TaxID=313368 RepID=A0A1M6ALZ7_9RHOB|nr:GNAT family N-acetyltransferase [Palleronia salina]SHI37243.1 hypothetical protein SAMN04488012_101168 [Palleronia salina]